MQNNNNMMIDGRSFISYVMVVVYGANLVKIIDIHTRYKQQSHHNIPRQEKLQ
jgi:hypothetical protein